MDFTPDHLHRLYAQFSSSLQVIHEMSERFNKNFDKLDQAQKICFAYHLGMMSTARVPLVQFGGGGMLNEMVAAVLKEDTFKYNKYIDTNEKIVMTLANKFETRYLAAVRANKEQIQDGTNEKRLLSGEDLKKKGVL